MAASKYLGISVVIDVEIHLDMAMGSAGSHPNPLEISMA
jgi:hypothetical protein